MQTLLSKILALSNEYLEFSIGTTQITLHQDYPVLWTTIRIFGEFQKVSMIYLWSSILNTITSTDQYQLDDEAYLLIFEFSIPTTFFFQIKNSAFQITTTIIMILFQLFLPLLNLLIMRQQQILYNKHKLSQKTRINQIVDESESMKQLKLQLLYGHSDYMNFWFQTGYQQDNAYTAQYLLLKINCYIVSVFSEVIYLPFLYFGMFNLFFNDQYDTQASVVLKVLSAILIIFTFMTLYISLTYTQQSLSIEDSNFTRIKRSFALTVSKLATLLSVFFIPFQFKLLQQESDPKLTITIMVLVSQTGELIDFFLSVPYVKEYKRYITAYMLSAGMVSTFIYIFTNEWGKFLNIFFVLFPLFGKLLAQLSDQQLLYIIEHTFVIEKPAQIKQQSADMKNLVQGAMIRMVIQLSKEKQIQSFQATDFNKLPHLLSIIKSFNMSKGYVIVKQEYNDRMQPVVPERMKNKIMVLTYVLLSKHQAQCENVFCFCKGYRGEKKTSIKSKEFIENMCVNVDLNFFQMSFYVEMVYRFLRNYSKIVFFVEKEKNYLPITLILQLLNFVADSDECVQSVLLALELAGRLAHVSQSISSFELLSINFLVNWVKFNILHWQNQLITPDQTERIFSYEDFRSTEKRRNKVFQQIVRNIQVKLDGLIKLAREQFSYEQIQDLYLAINQANVQTKTMIWDFRKRNNSKTSLLCDMFYNLEVVNNFSRFLQLQNKLRSYEEKFFEFPAQYFQMEIFCTEVSYLKVDLNCSKSGDSFNGILSRGWIKEFSRNCPQYCGYSYTEFQNIKNIRELQPHTTSLIHDDFIEIVLLTTRPYVLRSKLFLFIRTREGFLVYTEFIADFNFKLYNGEFTIYVFLRKIKDKARNGRIKNYFFIHKDGVIEGVTYDLLASFEIDDPLGEQLYQTHIAELIPEFEVTSKKLEDMLEAQIKDHEDKTGKESDVYSGTFESLQFVNSLQLENTLLRIPKKLSESQVDQRYLLECQVILKYASLIGRMYKIYLIEIINFSKLEADDHFRLNEFSNNFRTVPMQTLMNSGQMNNTQDMEQSNLLNISNIPVELETEDLKMDNFVYFEKSPTEEPNPNTNLNSQGQTQAQNNFGSNIDEIYSKSNENNLLSPRGSEKRFKDNLFQQQFFNNSEKDNVSRQSEMEDSERKEQFRRLEFEENQIAEQQSQGSTNHENSITSRLITKSNYYQHFASSSRLPMAIRLFVMFNFIYFAAILSFMVAVIASTLSWSSGLKGDISLLDSFSTTRYSNIVYEALSIEQAFRPSPKTKDYQYGRIAPFKLQYDYLQYAETFLFNIRDLKTVYTSQQQDQALSSIFKTEDITIYDTIFKNFKPVTMWTAINQISYYLEILGNETFVLSEINEPLQYFCKTFPNYRQVYSRIANKISSQIYNQKSQLSSLSSIYIYSLWILFIFFLVASFLIFEKLHKLQNKLTRCSEQISYASIVQEQFHMNKLVERFQINLQRKLTYIDIYAQNYEIKEKILTLTNADKRSLSLKQSMRKQVGNKKNLQLKDRVSIQSRLTFLIPLGAIFFFSIVYSVLSANSSLQANQIQTDLNVYQVSMTTVELFSQLLLTYHTVTNYNQTVNGLNEEELQDYKGIFTQSLTQFTDVIDQILSNQNNNYSEELQRIFQSNLCESYRNKTLCENLNQGLLKSGLSLTFSHFITKMRDGFDFGQQLSLQDILTSGIVIEQLQFFTQLTQGSTFTKIDDLNSLSTKQYIGFGIVFALIQLTIIYLTSNWIRGRFQDLKQFVYFVPPVSLYIEESFFKTLSYISQQEYQLVD